MQPVEAVLGRCDLAELRRRKSAKWRDYPPDVLPAWVAEMDFDVAREISEALREALELSDFGYAMPDSIAEPFAAFSASRWGWSPPPASLCAVPDVMTGVAEVVAAVTDPGDAVVINPPVYPPFFSRLALTGRRLAEVPLSCDDNGSYHLDLEALERALRAEGAAAYLLCNPHNPVGRVWSAGDLASVADLCLCHGVFLLVDEIHSPLVLAGAAHVPFLTLDHEMHEHSAAIVSASKGWNIAGLKCALVAGGSPAVVDALAARKEALVPSHLGALASVAAFGRAEAWLDAARRQLDDNRRLLSALLAEHLPSVRFVPPEASFLAWLDCRDLGLGDDPSAAFLEHGRVALSAGPVFGAEGRGYARLNIGTSPELVEQAVRAMASAVSRPGS